MKAFKPRERHALSRAINAAPPCGLQPRGSRYGFNRACVSGVVSATCGSATVPVML